MNTAQLNLRTETATARRNPSPAAAADPQLSLFAGPDRWVHRTQVASTSVDGKVYVVAVDAAGAWGCSCPRWIYDSQRRPCKHIVAVRGGHLVDGEIPAA